MRQIDQDFRFSKMMLLACSALNLAKMRRNFPTLLWPFKPRNELC